jgi:hypothetical protein
MKTCLHLIAAFLFVTPVLGQQNAQSNWTSRDCWSYAASYTGGWRTLASSPRDGTIIEMLETRGVAPSYDLFKWGDFGGAGGWVSVKNAHLGHLESVCAFWRPYHGNPLTYVDPTGGRDNTLEYWCDAMHMRYSKKRDRCY